MQRGAETFRSYGADPGTAAAMAAAVSADPDTALRVHAREELGVDPSELPSPVLAGTSSLAAFSPGALIPLLRSGLRQLTFGAVAVAVTFAAGSLIGSQVH